MTFQLDSVKTFAVVEVGVPGMLEKGPFMIWFSGAKPSSTALPDGITITNDGRNVTVSYRSEACFVVRRYVC